MDGVLLAIFVIVGGRVAAKVVAVAVAVAVALAALALTAEVSAAAEVADGGGVMTPDSLFVRERFNLEEVPTTVGGASASRFLSKDLSLL